MGNILVGSELVKIGIQIEKNGRDFYNALAVRSKNKKIKEMFDFLAGEEEKHIVAFEKILDGIKGYEPAESYPGEYTAYMNILASEYVFTQKDTGGQLAGKVKDETEAVDLGIGFEKDSIVFYLGMRKALPEYDYKVIDELIAQEEEHLRMLLDVKKTERLFSLDNDKPI